MSALAVTGASQRGAVVGLRCENGVIAAIGPGAGPQAGDEVIDADGLELMPGFVNAHTHCAMTLFRGYADDLPLMRWLEDHIWPAEARLDAEDVYWGARLGCLEMIRAGVVRFWDMYWHPGATARAASDAGLRAVIGGPLIGAEASTADADEQIDESLGALESFASDPLIDAAVSPHAIYSVSPAALRRAAERATEAGLPFQIHLSETEQEVDGCLAAHGMRPAELLASLGALSPKTLLAHGVWLDPAELELIAEQGATVVTNPVANMKLAVGGVFPFGAARAAGVAIGLGTDGPGSNNGLDLLADAKLFALVQKHHAGDAAAISAAEVLEIARGSHSPLLGRGSLEPGAPADFVLVRRGHPGLAIGELDAGLLYAAGSDAVDTTVVAGRVLMRDRRIEGEEEIIAQARDRAARLLGSGRYDR